MTYELKINFNQSFVYQQDDNSDRNDQVANILNCHKVEVPYYTWEFLLDLPNSNMMIGKPC